MVLPQLLYSILIITVPMACVVGTIWLISLMRPRRVFWDSRSSKYIERGSEEYPKYRARFTAYRRRMLSILVTALLVMSGFLAWTVFSGENGAQNAALEAVRSQQDESRAASFIAPSEAVLVEPLSIEKAREIASGKVDTFTAKVFFPDGSEHEADFQVQGTSSSLFGTRTFDVVPATDEEAAYLNENGWQPDAALQRVWQLQGIVFPELEERYGIVLTAEQRAALGVPEFVPTHLTRYGTVDVTTPLPNGSYFNGTATLIWDGDFKLIGSEGTDHAAELSRQ